MTFATLATILAMAIVTYLTRIGGYLLLRRRRLGPRAAATLTVAPGCVLISVIAPHFVANNPADLIALGLTLAAATRLPILPTVLIAVASAATLRAVLGH